MSRPGLVTTLCVIILMSATYSFSHAAEKLDESGSKDQSKAQPKLRALIIDGQNNHDWKTTTPLLRKALKSTGRFTVEVDTVHSPAGDVISVFNDYDVVVSNYNGNRWPPRTEKDFEAYIAAGGGFVTVHAADNSFPDWPEYNRIIGVGGWGGRNQKSGPRVYIDDQGDVVRDKSAGKGGHHGQQHEFQLRSRDAKHPIMRGLPPIWMHTKDELYDSLRGPAEGTHVLATTYSAPDKGGSGRNEPMLMTVEYGKGRVFHSVLGHADYSMNCVGFITTFQRGAEWAATGKVTIPVPDNFPTAETSKSISK
jgi:type 1 glutamine amidotransferase